MDEYVYIFEFKMDGTAEEALHQIAEKGYARSYLTDNRKIVCIGVNFLPYTRTVEEWKEIIYKRFSHSQPKSVKQKIAFHSFLWEYTGKNVYAVAGITHLIFIFLSFCFSFAKNELFSQPNTSLISYRQ